MLEILTVRQTRLLGKVSYRTLSNGSLRAPMFKVDKTADKKEGMPCENLSQSTKL